MNDFPTLALVCEIQAGFSFRGRIESVTDGPLRVMQPSDLVGSEVRWDRLVHTHDVGAKPQHYLREGDVLVTARGAPTRAGLIDRQEDGVIASSTFFVLRPDTRLVDPAYLAWYIGQPRAQMHLDTCRTGTHIPNLTKECLGSLPLPLPPLPVQHRIAEVAALASLEASLTQRLIVLRARLVSEIGMSAADQAALPFSSLTTSLA